MALKGFLASGFQKLIGASRIKGANEQWLGEYNKSTFTGNAAPISTISPVFGFNYIEWTPTSTVFIADSNALFSVNPTTPTIVTIRNASSTNQIICNNSGSVAGSLVGDGAIYLRYNQTITYLYDPTTSRWQEIGRSVEYRTAGWPVVGSAISAIGSRMQSISVSAAADQTVTTITPAMGVQPGDLVTLYVAGATSPITLQQDTAGTGTNTLVMNGDYVLTKNSTISFIYDGTRWIELSRNMVGGY